jgi:hypothetical protein
MSCRGKASLPQNAILDAGTITEIRTSANIFLTVPSAGQIGRKFKSSADYLRYKKAGVLAGSSPSLVLPPQADIITQLQASDKC